MIWLRRALALAIVLTIWQIVVWLELTPERYLPSPGRTLEALFRVLTTPEDMRMAGTTLLRALAGFVLTVPLGIALGVLGALVPQVQRMLRPWAELLRPLPPAAIIPLCMFVFGLGLKLYLFIIVFAAIWPVYFNTVAAFAGTSDVLLRTGRAFGYSKFELIRSVVLPQALPQIFIGVRIAAAVSVIGSVVTDLFAGQDGLGYLLFERAWALRIPDVFALTVVCGMCGMLFNEMVLRLRRIFIGWHEKMMAEAAA
jgi:ABC-type nitrate/sulfonate/bicarbonate transport system permease component